MSDNTNPVRIPSDPEGYDVVSSKGDPKPCFTCALFDRHVLCMGAKCIPASRPDGAEIKYVKTEGAK